MFPEVKPTLDNKLLFVHAENIEYSKQRGIVYTVVIHIIKWYADNRP